MNRQTSVFIGHVKNMMTMNTAGNCWPFDVRPPNSMPSERVPNLRKNNRDYGRRNSVPQFLRTLVKKKRSCDLLLNDRNFRSVDEINN